MNLAQPQQIDPLWFFAFFVCLWVAVVSMLSVKGGWYELSQQYRATMHVTGENFRMVSGSLGSSPFPVSYGGCLLVTVSATGFSLGVFILFRLLHPKLFIPWSAVESVNQDRYYFRKRTTVVVRDFDKRISLYGAVGESVAAAFKRAQGHR